MNPIKRLSALPAWFRRLSIQKKIILAAVLAVILAAAVLLILSRSGTAAEEDAVYVQKVSDLTNTSVTMDRYSGVVESHKTQDFKKDPERTVETIYVQVGQEVQQDTPLFKYDVRETENTIASLKLEIEGINNEISVLKSGGNDTETKLQISQKELELSQKKAELDKNQKQIDQSVVKSTIPGIVKSVNENEGTDNNGRELPVVSVTETGQFRVKGKVSEQSIGTLSSGQEVIVRSRLDEDQTWSGTISAIETEPAQNQNSDMMSDGGGERASSYPFYVSLESTEGLMLGQHVFIEPDYGQTQAREGLWLDQSFIVEEEDGSAYVWVEKRGKLDRRTVELGERDDEEYTVQITGGLTENDWITWPDEELKEGMKVQRPEVDE